jgi:RND superfamily putative drug exporter
MFGRLATFLHANGRRVLAVAIVGAAIAGAFGFSVSKHLSPYGANDPATQSVQATNRFEHAAGRQIDAGVVALVQSGDVRTPGAHGRVNEVAAQLRAQPDVARVVSFYDTHDPGMVSRDGRSTYVLAYFKPLSDKALKDVAQQIENRFCSSARWWPRCCRRCWAGWRSWRRSLRCAWWRASRISRCSR